ncbi:unnamed protein product [Calypogeia fissa]
MDLRNTIGRWVVFLVCLLLLSLKCPGASAQPGFLNIDCGAAQNSTDGTFNWVTDTGYTPAGYDSGPLDLGTYFRYFNDSRNKNCYKLPVQPDTTYLVRASFLYSNFSQLFGNVNFDLTINTSYWTTVNISPVIDSNADNPGVYTVMRKEVIFRSNGSTMDVCLVRGNGLPFINALVLRTLADNMYVDVKRAKLLVTQWRWSPGFCCISETRYPDDPYDRIWETQYGLGTIFQNTTLLNTSASDVNQPPVAVTSYAWDWNDTTPSTWFYNGITDFSGQYYSAAYFQEVDASASPSATRGSRYLTVALNGLYTQNVTVRSTLSAVTSFFQSSVSGVNLTVAKTFSWSKGPLMNGWEFFSARNFNLSSTSPDDVHALDILRSVLGTVLLEWSGDPCFPEPWEWVTCSTTVGNQPSRVTQINLSSMQLDGSLPANITGLFPDLTSLRLDNNTLSGSLPDFSSLTNLQTLRLENNIFSGSIPSTLADLPLLSQLSLQNNNFSGSIPQSLIDRVNNPAANFKFLYTGNPFLQMPGNTPGSRSPSADAHSAHKKTSGSSSALQIGLAVAGAAVAISALIFFVVLYCCCYKGQQQQPKEEEVGVLSFDPEAMHQARSFTLQEVKDVTHNFARKLGEGSYGPVYYGRLGDGSEVAVKVNHKDSRQGTNEFINEVTLLSRVHHKFLVSLVGYCEAAQEQILIYAYMPNGTLTEHLHGDSDVENPLPWRVRLDIALNAAQGLEYLHMFCNPPIIHRDVKPSNILLDHTFLAKVADFGMSKSCPAGSQTGFSTAVKGTFGYLDPEYLGGWRLTEKSDVYSFGVVLLELVTGRKPTAIIQFQDGIEGNFMTWTKAAQRNGNILSIVDPALGNDFSMEAMWKVAELAWASIDPTGTNRPDMGEIVRGLMEAIQLERSGTFDNVMGPSSVSSGSPLNRSRDLSASLSSISIQSARL